MRVILQQKMVNLGQIGDEVVVKRGYARNFLYPTGKAVPATPKNIAEFEKRRTELEKAAELMLEKAKQRAELLKDVSVVIKVNASNEGKLFGSVGAREIAAALVEAGASVEKQEISLPEGAIRVVGEHSVMLRLHSDVVAQLNITVEAE